MIVVQKASKDSITYKLLDEETFEPLDLASATAEVLSPSGNTLSVPGVVTTSDEAATFTPSGTWDQDLEAGYSIKWTLTPSAAGQPARERWTFFRVVLRRFVSQVTDSEITSIQPIISSELPSGVTTLASWRRSAWKDIQRYVERALGDYAGNIFAPEEFSEAHIFWTIRDFYLSNMTEGGGDDEARASKYEDKGAFFLNRVMGSVGHDKNESGTFTKREQDRIHQVNWRT